MEVLALQGLCKLRQLLDSVRLDKLFVVEVVEEKIETLLGVLDLHLEGLRCLASHTLHVTIQDIHKLLGVCWNVRPVTCGVTRLS